MDARARASGKLRTRELAEMMSRHSTRSATRGALLSGQAQAIGVPATILGQIEAAMPGEFGKKFARFVQRNAIAAEPKQAELIKAVDLCLSAADTSGLLRSVYRKGFKFDEIPHLQD
jgi:hypothetical protein